MPFKRTYRRKRRAYKKKRYYRKNRIYRPLGKVHYISRGAYVGSITANAATAQTGAYSFALSSLPNYTEFTNLFDEYKIYKIKLTLVPVGVTQFNTVNIVDGWFMYVVDKDDDNVPADYTVLQQYPNCKVKRFAHTIKCVFRPRFSAQVYNGVTTGYASRSGFLDCTNAGVPHYGFKYVMAHSQTGGTVGYDVWAHYYCAFRGIR